MHLFILDGSKMLPDQTSRSSFIFQFLTVMVSQTLKNQGEDTLVV